MRKRTLALLGLALACPALADDGPGLPRDVSFRTLITTPLAIEGLTGDGQGNLYTTGRRGIGLAHLIRRSQAGRGRFRSGDRHDPVQPFRNHL
jgi:hypothetical protein